MMLNHVTHYPAPRQIYNRRNFTYETGKTVLTNGATSPGRYENLGSLTGRVSSADLVAVTNSAPVGVAPPSANTGRVVRYELPNFGGQAMPDLQRVGFNDRAASIVIERGTWTFCTDAGFRGDCRTLVPGQYAWVPRDVDRRIASARRVSDAYGAL